MNSFTTISSSFILFLLCSRAPVADGQKTESDSVPKTISGYRDGIYLGISRGGYDLEPFWGIIRLKIDSGRFTEVSFVIRDSSLHEQFDYRYEKHFEGNPVYIQQCRNDWNGVQVYPVKLSEQQDTGRLDAISGATWSYHIFRRSVTEALKRGRAGLDTLSGSQGR